MNTKITNEEADELNMIVEDLENIAEQIRGRCFVGGDRKQLILSLVQLTRVRVRLDLTLAGQVAFLLPQRPWEETKQIVLEVEEMKRKLLTDPNWEKGLSPRLTAKRS
jgi:hypothetical protein